MGATEPTEGGTLMRKYTFRVYPKGMSREVSRTMEVSGQATLDELCYHILDSLSFDSDHLYEFCMDNRMYGDNSYVCEDPWSSHNETAIKIDALRLYKGQNFSLHYDFGDDWMFTIHVNKIEEVEGRVPYRLLRSKGELQQYPSWDDEDEDW